MHLINSQKLVEKNALFEEIINVPHWKSIQLNKEVFPLLHGVKPNGLGGFKTIFPSRTAPNRYSNAPNTQEWLKVLTKKDQEFTDKIKVWEVAINDQEIDVAKSEVVEKQRAPEDEQKDIAEGKKTETERVKAFPEYSSLNYHFGGSHLRPAKQGMSWKVAHSKVQIKS